MVDTHKQVSAIPRKLDDVQSILKQIRDQQESAAEDHYSSLSEQFGIEAQNALRPLLEGLMKDFERGLERLSQQIQANQFLTAIELYRSLTPFSQARIVGITVQQVLNALQVDPLGMTTDLRTVLRAGQQLDVRGHRHTSEFLQNDRFKRWCSSVRPDILIVDIGMVDGVTTPKISPLSSACASIATTIIKAQPNAILLLFFCGLHAAPNDALRGPQGVMRTLIARLLVELDGRDLASLNFIDTSEYWQALQLLETRALCHAFTQLVRQWPLDSVVYCIIDGVGWCEHKEWPEDLQLVMNTLQDLVCDRRLPTIFKVLLSSSMRSQTVSKSWPLENRISIGVKAGPAREAFPPERYLLLSQSKAEFSQMRGDGNITDDDFYT